jgi:hypothetical protein
VSAAETGVAAPNRAADAASRRTLTRRMTDAVVGVELCCIVSLTEMEEARFRPS